MSDHPVKQKLERSVVPYLVSARHLKKQWFYRFHRVFGYSSDFVGALSVIGVGTPLLPFFIKLNEPIDPSSSTIQSAVVYLDSLPSGLYWTLVLIVVSWLAMRIFYIREEGHKKAVLVTSCVQAFKLVETKLHQILGKQDPMPALNEMLETLIFPVVDRNAQEGAWPWGGPAPSTIIGNDARTLLDELCTNYQAGWATPPNTDLRAVKAGG